MQLPHVKAAIEAAMGERIERTKIDADRFLCRLVNKADADLADILDDAGAVRAARRSSPKSCRCGRSNRRGPRHRPCGFASRAIAPAWISSAIRPVLSGVSNIAFSRWKWGSAGSASSLPTGRWCVNAHFCATQMHFLFRPSRGGTNRTAKARAQRSGSNPLQITLTLVVI